MHTGVVVAGKTSGWPVSSFHFRFVSASAFFSALPLRSLRLCGA
jgi:hypothetical protein